MEKHTPGPWKYDENTGIIRCPDGHPIFHEWREEQKEANVRLIAAAPDLLTACELSKHAAGNLLLIAASELQRAGQMEFAIRLREKHQAEVKAIAAARGDPTNA